MTGFIAGWLLGFGGSLHCMAMCGPLVLHIKFKDKSKFKTVINTSLYHFGRLLMYATLGFFAGLLGWAVSLGEYHQWLSLTMGVLILITGIMSFTGRLSLPGINISWFSKGISFTKRFPRVLSLFFLGMMNGLLPCGLVYVAIGASVVMSSPLSAAFFMMAFGVGTTPLLAALPAFQNMWQQQLSKTSLVRLNWKGILSIIAGLLLILRGLSLDIPYVSPSMEQKVGTVEYFCH